MATDHIEAQRLIAMSIGKITASRGQRGGMNLHKNLLVATVLTKARTIYMLEHYQSIMETQRNEFEAEETEEETVEITEKTASVSEVHAVSEAPNGESEQSSCRFAPVEEEVDKENSPPNHQVVTHHDMDINCVRCSKRRLSDEEMYDFDRDTNTPCAKKHKTDYDSENTVPKTYEKMQVETPQMTNLVNSFNSGFTGLINAESNPNTDQGYSSAEDEDDDVFTSSTRSKSENSLISCSTQIKEAFETLARPCIALSV